MICDYLTKWLEAIAVTNQETTTIADRFVKEFVCEFDVPLQLNSDQGENFESLLFKGVCKLLGIEKDKNYTTATKVEWISGTCKSHFGEHAFKILVCIGTAN